MNNIMGDKWIMIRKLAYSALGAAWVLLAGATFAQNQAAPQAPVPQASVAPQAAVPPVAAAQPEEDVREQRFDIELSKGKLVRLDAPASAVIAADPTIADVQVVSPSLVYVNGKGVGETTVFAVDSKDHEILRATVSVTHNLSKLNRAVKQMLPDAKVNFQSIDGALVMNGDVATPLQAEEVRRLAAPFVKQNQTLVNMLHPRGSDQVMLKVKVAEVDRTVTKAFGINLQNISNVVTGGAAWGLTALTGRSILSSGQTLGTNPSSAVIPQSTTADTLGLHFGDSSNNLNTIIDALDENGLVTTLAEPTLTTQSGQPASFLAGGEIPVPAVTGSGSTAQVSINYQPYGVSLNFTPTVLSKSRISLAVNPEVSSLTTTGEVSDAGFTIPALITRKASTTVELASGQSFAIAGLLQNDGSNDIQKFPFLGDVPVLGALFRSSNFQHNQTELMIIVTPYIVGGVEERKALHDPTEGLVWASDAERVLLGKLYSERPPGKGYDSDVDAVDKPRLTGPAGYVLQ